MLVFNLLNFNNSYSQQSKQVPNVTYQYFINSLKKLELDESKVYPVSSMFITRDVGEIVIDSGYIILSKPVLGRIPGGVFVGASNFQFTPPTTIEQDQLERFLKIREINNPIKEFAFFTADSIIHEIQRNYQPVQFKIPSSTSSLWNTSIKYFTAKYSTQILNMISTFILENTYDPSFVAMLAPESGSELLFTFDPNEEEEISFYKYLGNIAGQRLADLICQFHVSDYYKSPNIDSVIEAKRRVKIEKYDINCVIENSLYTKFNAEIKMKINCPQLQWISMDLYQDFSIKSAKDEKNQNLSFYNDEDEAGVKWIKLDKPLKKGDSLVLKLDYEGKSLARFGNITIFKTSTGWYPKVGYREKAYFDIKIQYPDNYKLVCIGDLLKTEEKDGNIIQTYHTRYPIRNANFTIGNFDVREMDKDSAVPKTLYYVNSDFSEQVLEDIKYSILFYNHFFDTLDIKHFNAAEIPFGYGEAFPGMINLSSGAFISSSKDGWAEQFAAHEVGHQWFGIGVDFKTYHDQWLSEGITEYISLMFMQQFMNDNEKFFERMEDYKKDLLNVRNSILQKGIDPGPISLGYRNNSFNTGGDYSLIVYKKGAWVLHMLRNMMINFNKKMNEDSYLSLMKNVFKKYKNKRISTDEFRMEVENIVKFDMKWFFNQWVDGNKIPKYTYSYKTEKQSNDLYKIKMRVKQTNVPKDFQMIIPICVDMGQNRRQLGRVRINGSTTEFDLPFEAPYQPQKIIFNVLQSVLCEVEEEDWE